MRRLVYFSIVTFAIALVGCAEKQEFRSIRKSVPTSVISLSPGTTEILLSNTSLPALAGRTQADNFPEQRAATVPVVASVKPDYEKIASIKPSHIVYDASLYSPQDIEKLKSTTKAELFPIDANTIDGFVEELYMLGSLMISETTINDYANRILRARSIASSETEGERKKVAILMPGSGGSDYIAGTKSFVADAVRAAGGEPVGPEASVFVPLNAEVMIGFDPDLIIVPGTKTDLAGAKAVAANPRYKTLKAIANGRLKVIERDILLRRGARVDKLIEGLDTALSGASK